MTGRLTPIGCFSATLSLRDTFTVTDVDVFREMEDAFLAWYDARELWIILDNYPTLIKRCQVSPTSTV